MVKDIQIKSPQLFGSATIKTNQYTLVPFCLGGSLSQHLPFYFITCACVVACLTVAFIACLVSCLALVSSVVVALHVSSLVAR
jgi:hypothetical protein